MSNMTKREPEDEASLDPSTTDGCDIPAELGDQPTDPPVTLNKMYGQITTAVQVGSIRGDLNIVTAPDPQDRLLEQVLLPIKAFLIDFELYLEQVGDMQAQLTLIPLGMWPVIDVTAYQHTDIFLERVGMRNTPSLEENIDIREALALLSKVAWERGYLMTHFHRLQRIPRPIRPVDPVAIMNKIIAEGDPAHLNHSLGTAIEVPLQRAISMCTEPEAVARALRMVGEDLHRIFQPHLHLLCDTARTMHSYGVLAAIAETAINASPSTA